MNEKSPDEIIGHGSLLLVRNEGTVIVQVQLVKIWKKHMFMSTENVMSVPRVHRRYLYWSQMERSYSSRVLWEFTITPLSSGFIGWKFLVEGLGVSFPLGIQIGLMSGVRTESHSSYQKRSFRVTIHTYWTKIWIIFGFAFWLVILKKSYL